jgi:predicted RNA-binding Zn-ribbon protein involved in translation (DUF1610 family)
MSEPDPVATTIINLANTIARRVKHGACPACDTEDWTYQTDCAVPVQWAIPRTDGTFGIWSTGTAHLAIAFVCPNCGYIRWHMPTMEMRAEALANTLE